MPSMLERLKTLYWAVVHSHRYLKLVTKIAISEHIAGLQSEYRGTRRLEAHGFRVYSQGDEDGIIQEIFLRIGATDRRFVEIGSGNGEESNCTSYLVHQEWSGLWVDDPGHAPAVSRSWPDALRSKRLRFSGARVKAGEIDAFLTGEGLSGDIDLFVIDIDGNDYHVLKAMTGLRPRVICVEYNASFPPPYRWIMPLNDDHQWDGTMHYGASLSALEHMLRDKGYSLVGCSLTGANAFFVLSELAADRFDEPLTAEHLYQPPRQYLAYMPIGMRFGFLTGHRIRDWERLT